MLQPLGCISVFLGFTQAVWVLLALISAFYGSVLQAHSSGSHPPLRKVGLAVSKEEQQPEASAQLELAMACFFSGRRAVAGLGSVIHEPAPTRNVLAASVLGPRADSNFNGHRVPGESQ